MKQPLRRIAVAAALACACGAARADPVSAVAIASSIFAMTPAAAAIGFTAMHAFLISTAASVFGMAQQRRKARKAAAQQRAAYNASLQDRTVSVLRADPPWQVIYGRGIVGGAIVDIFGTDKTVRNEYGTSVVKADGLKHLVIALAAHEVAAIHEMYIDGVPVGPVDGSGWATTGEFYTARSDSREVTFTTTTTIPEAATAILSASSVSGVGVDTIYTDETANVSIAGGGLTLNCSSGNSVTVYYTVATSGNGVRWSKHLGTSAQTVDTYLNAVAPTRYTSNHRLRGIAYVTVTLDLELTRFQGGPPNLTFDVSGRKLLDTRTGATAWSQNPALAVRDFLASEWGFGAHAAEVSDAFTNAAANAAEVRQLAAVHAHAATFTASASTDELTFASERWFGVGDGVRFTTSGTLPAPLAAGTTYYAIPGASRTVFKFATSRANAIAGTAINITSAGSGTHTGTWYDYDTYTCNGAFTSEQAPEAVLEDLAECMAGAVVYGGEWQVNAGAWTAPVMALTDADLSGAIEIVQADTPSDELFNGVHGQFIKHGSASPSDFNPYQNATFLAADGRELWEDVALPFTADLAHARNLSRVFVERNRSGQVIRFPAKLKAWTLQVGDRVTVTSDEYGFAAKAYRVTDWQFDIASPVVLTLQEDDASIYDLADAAVPDPTPNTALPNPWVVGNLTGVSAQSDSSTVQISAGNAIVPRVLVSWDAVTDAYVTEGGRIEALWRRPGGPWQQINVPGDGESVYLVGPSHGDPILIEVRARNSFGQAGPSSFVAHTVVGAAAIGWGDPGSFFDGFEGADTARWVNYSGSGERSIQAVGDAGSGGRVLRVGNNSGNDQAWLIHSATIPFDPTALYRVKARIRRTHGIGTTWIGLAGVAADGSTLVNASGSNSHSSQHYVAAAGAAPASSWTEYTGYVRGVDTAGSTSAHADPSDPGVMHEDVRYIRPLLLVNYNGETGRTEIDYVSIERLGGAIGTGDLGEDAATEVFVDEHDFAGASYGTTTARTLSYTPDADCLVELTMTLVAEEVYGDAGHFAFWTVAAGGGSDVTVANCDSQSTAKQQFSDFASFAASAGVPLTFKLKTQRPTSDPDVVLYDSYLRVTAIKR